MFMQVWYVLSKQSSMHGGGYPHPQAAWDWLGTRLGGGKVGKRDLNEGGNPFAEDTLSSWQSCLCVPD